MEKDLKFFLINIIIIALVGVVMVFSSSYIYAKEVFGTSSYFFLKQISFLGLGGVICFLTSKTRVSFWLKYSLHINFIMIVLLLMAKTDTFGVVAKGSKRWLDLKIIGVQPGELVKFSLLLVSIKFFRFYTYYNLKQTLAFVGSMILVLSLLLLQPDFGSFTICLLIIFFVCFLSNFPRKYLYTFMGIGLATMVSAILIAPYRMKRVLVFLDPWKDPHSSGFQIIQSFLAFANGSIFGQGLGNSNEKLFYLPEAHNDFIFSVIAEETGFLGVLVLVGLFVWLLWQGLKLGTKEQDPTTAMLICSIVFIICIQAFLNMGVVIGILPTKGLNLPFISSGGSSLISNLWGIGLILSAKNLKSEPLNVSGPKRPQAPRRTQGHRVYLS